MTKDVSKKYNRLIGIVSVVIPVVVALLFGVKLDVELPVFLPPIYAGTNGLTAVVLIVAVWAIKSGKRGLHEKLMKLAVTLSALFLIAASLKIRHENVCDAKISFEQ